MTTPNAVDPNVVAQIVDVMEDYIRTRGYTFHQTSADTLAMTEAVRDILGTRVPTVVRAGGVGEASDYELTRDYLPDDIRVALNTLLDKHSLFDLVSNDQTHDAYIAADKACRVLIARTIAELRSAAPASAPGGGEKAHEQEEPNDTARLNAMERFLVRVSNEFPDEKIGFEIQLIGRRFVVTVTGPDDCYYGDSLREAIDAGRAEAVTTP